ncbi:unnamed protein product [Cuscuta epithymum]|uniref:Uncharacterized protein n=1 Tax=Cuscuta epithymum TaxID=186058 RepID=A0AAV0DI42_9ASTE|nr:unnamed protein product [Cuscuta epithymum]CAH9143751.1 unnamed protein product [Cuscuta epithymum]
MDMAATSWARAAISGVAKVPSQMRDFFLGSRISDTHFPHARIRTPTYDGCFRSVFRLPPPATSLRRLCGGEEDELQVDSSVKDKSGSAISNYSRISVLAVCIFLNGYMCINIFEFAFTQFAYKWV